MLRCHHNACIKSAEVIKSIKLHERQIREFGAAGIYLYGSTRHWSTPNEVVPTRSMALPPRRTAMAKKHKPEEIVAKLRQVDVLTSPKERR